MSLNLKFSGFWLFLSPFDIFRKEFFNIRNLFLFGYYYSHSISFIPLYCSLKFSLNCFNSLNSPYEIASLNIIRLTQ